MWSWSSLSLSFSLSLSLSRLSFQTAPKACDSDGCTGHWKDQSHKICLEFSTSEHVFHWFFPTFSCFPVGCWQQDIWIFVVTWLIAVGWKMLQHTAPVDIPNPIPRLIRLISCRQSVIPKPFAKTCWLNMSELWIYEYLCTLSWMVALLNFRFCFPPKKKQNIPSIPSPPCKGLKIMSWVGISYS